MFSFVFSFCPTCCTKYLCFEASQHYSLLQVFREFRSFLNFEKISTSGVTQRDLGPARGTHQWPRRPAGAAQPLAAPTGRLGPTWPPSRYVFFLPLSFSPKT